MVEVTVQIHLLLAIVLQNVNVAVVAGGRIMYVVVRECLVDAVATAGADKSKLDPVLVNLVGRVPLFTGCAHDIVVVVSPLAGGTVAECLTAQAALIVDAVLVHRRRAQALLAQIKPIVAEAVWVALQTDARMPSNVHVVDRLIDICCQVVSISALRALVFGVALGALAVVGSHIEGIVVRVAPNFCVVVVVIEKGIVVKAAVGVIALIAFPLLI